MLFRRLAYLALSAAVALLACSSSDVRPAAVGDCSAASGCAPPSPGGGSSAPPDGSAEEDADVPDAADDGATFFDDSGVFNDAAAAFD